MPHGPCTVLLRRALGCSVLEGLRGGSASKRNRHGAVARSFLGAVRACRFVAVSMHQGSPSWSLSEVVLALWLSPLLCMA